MSAQAATRLADRLDRELAWRKRELIAIYLDTSAGEHGAETSHRCRGALLMLYAHWEGFVKFAFTAYLEEASREVQDARLFNDSLLGLSVKAWVLNVAERRNSKFLGQVLRQAMDPSEQLPRLREAKLVQTKSNVSPAVLSEILATVGLDEQQFSQFDLPVIKPLVRSRNEIAHGASNPVVAARFRQFHHRVFDLIDAVRDYLEDSLAARRYAK